MYISLSIYIYVYTNMSFIIISLIGDVQHREVTRLSIVAAENRHIITIIVIYIYIYIYHRGPVSRQTICVLSIRATMISQALREKLRPSAL